MERAFNQEIHEFAAYSRHSRLLGKLVSILVFYLLTIVLPFGCLVVGNLILHAQTGLLPLQVIVLQVMFAALFLLGVLLLLVMLPYTISTLRRLVSHKPALLITQQGIDFKDVPVVGTISLSWGEVASLSPGFVDRPLANRLTFFTADGHLCCGLEDHVQFLSRFPPFRRFLIIGLCSLTTGTLIHIPYWYFSEPVGEILSQIQVTFQDQLQAHEVHVFCSHSEKSSVKDAT